MKVASFLLGRVLLPIVITLWVWTVVFQKQNFSRAPPSPPRFLLQTEVELLVAYPELQTLPKFVNPCKSSEESSPSRLAKCIRKRKDMMMAGDCPSRLGNQMYSYAVVFAIAHYNNRTAYLSPSMSDFLSKYFNVSAGTIASSVYNRIRWQNVHLGGNAPASVRKLTKPYLKFTGTPQSWKYFDEIRPLILQELRFYDHIAHRTELELTAIRRDKFRDSNVRTTLVGLHIRRGDYVEEAKREKFEMPTIEFYEGAMRYFAKKFENVIFVLASNDMAWCEENITPLLGKYRIQVLKKTPEEEGGFDLARLAYCDHLIFGLGTFGFWAGYLNGGEVVYCSDCITEDTGWLRNKKLYSGDYRNVVLPSWIGFSRNGTQSSELAKTTHLAWW